MTSILRSSRRRFAIALAAAISILLPDAASAHPLTGAAAGFISGFSHPLSGWDHMLAMVAVGMWGAQLGQPAIWQLPVAFPMMMAVGGFLALIGVPLPLVEMGIAASAIVLGLAVATEWKPPLAVALAIVAAFAIFHGHAHGAELTPGTNALLYSAGFVMATGSLHGVGITIGLLHQWPIGRQALRGAGALVLIAGTFFLWRAIE
jgi:urease accessory protein